MSYPRSPRRRVHPTFRARIYSCGIPLYELAQRAGFPTYTALSSALCDWRDVAATTSLLSRLQVLVALLGYEGPVLVEDVPHTDPRDEFSLATLPRP